MGTAEPATRPPGGRAAVPPARVAALVPCHREPPGEALLAALAAQVGTLLVVDDGMPAPAARDLDSLAAGLGCGVLRLGRNLGKGHALARGIAALTASAAAPEAVLVADADDQHPPAAVPAFLRASAAADLVIGDRFGDLAAMPVDRRLANRSASALLRLTTGAGVRDSQCGMRLLRGRALGEVPFPPGGFEAETRHLVRCLRARVAVAWVPIPAHYGDEVSAFRPLRDSARVLRASFG